MDRIPKQVKSVGTKNNSVAYIKFSEKIVTVTIFYGAHHKIYEIEYGETDIYLGQVGSIDYYLNLNNGENDVFAHYPITGKTHLLSAYEQNMVLREIIGNH